VSSSGIDIPRISPGAQEAKISAALFFQKKEHTRAKGPSAELVQLILEMKRRNPRFNTPESRGKLPEPLASTSIKTW
jgi:hypothetical protein